ncbi:MAG: phosphotransferase [Anaerolineales bacterium]|nr:phosphotransferase [Anaerolineales bacterium]
MKLDDIVLQAAAQKYGVNGNKLTPLKGGLTNFVFQYNHAGKDLVLRILTPDAEIDHSTINANMAWLNFLAQNDASVARPVPSTENKLIEVIDFSSESYFVFSCEKAIGVLSETLPIDQWNDPLFQSLGKTVGKMHKLATSYTPTSNIIKHPEWDQSANIFNPDCLDDAELNLVYQRRAAIIAQLADFQKDAENFGIIHCDLHFANFFVDTQNEIITIFDFDDCAYGWYIMDIATLLLDLCVVYSKSNKESFAANFMHNFLSGYLSEKHLDNLWISRIPVFLKLLECSLYIDVYKYWNPEEKDSWVGKFMPDRRISIEEDKPFINLNFSEFLPI